MRFKDFAFVAPGRRAGWLGWILLFGGALTFAVAADRWRESNEQLQLAQNRLEHRLALMPPERAVKRVVEITPEMEARNREQKAIDDMLRRDWSSLFVTLEATLGPDIALLSVQPDARRGTVIVTGEARNVPALIAYEQRLDRRLRDVVLSTHEIQELHPQKPVRFSMSARWSQGESS